MFEPEPELEHSHYLSPNHQLNSQSFSNSLIKSQQQPSSNLFQSNPNNNNNQSISKPVGQFNLSIQVTNFETKVVGREEIIFFKTDLYSAITKREWSIFHRYTDFYDFNRILSKSYINAPTHVIRTYTKIANLSELVKRKEEMNNFVIEISNRSDLLSSIYSIKFFKLENHYPDLNLYQPLQLYHLEDQLSFPITSGYFLRHGSLLFLGLGKAPSGLNNLLSKFYLFKPQSKSPLGQVIIFNIIRSHQGACHFEPLLAKELISECTSINFYSGKNCLCIGMNNGHVALYKIYINETSAESREFAEFACVIKGHTQPIVGACANFQLGYLYSFAQETTIRITELNNQTLMKEIPLTKHYITLMEYDERWGRVILCDQGNIIYFIDLMTNPLQPMIIQTFYGLANDITCLYTQLDNNLILLGTSNGTVSMYKIMHYNEKLFSFSNGNNNGTKIEMIKVKEINLYSKVTVKQIVITHKEEMLFALSNGSIAVYVHEMQNAEYVIDAHMECVSSIFWDEEKKFVISISEDKSIKMMQLPIYWPGEMMRKCQETNRKKVIDGTIKEELGMNCGGNTSLDSSFYNDEVMEEKRILKKEKQVWSEDLDGWSTEM